MMIKITLNEPSDFNTAILVLRGKVKINDEKNYVEDDFILFDNVEGEISVEGISEDSLILVLSGKPIKENVVSYGPFVMNTVDEIYEAYNDFENGKFGTMNF